MITVSVLMITYNHEEYIEAAIKSVLMQKTDFEIELVIGDDGSTDKTGFICENLAMQYSELIRYEYNEKNIGMNPNFLKTYHRCRGKYIALLEGDDQWIDRLKLQKQVELLEQDDSIVAVLSNAEIVNVKNKKRTLYYSSDERKPNKRSDLERVIKGLAICTGTFIFRKVIGNFPNWFVETRASAYFLYYLLADKGDFCFLDEPLSRYNQHFNGMATKTDVVEMLYLDTQKLKFLPQFYRNKKRIKKLVAQRYLIAINHLYDRPEYLKAFSLFWKLPFGFMLPFPDLYSQVMKAFLKVNFRVVPSKKIKKSIY